MRETIVESRVWGSNRPVPAKAATGALLIEIKDKLTVRVKIDS